MLRHEHRVEADDGDGGGFQGADDDEGRVRDVQARSQPPRDHAGEAVDGEQVDDERVAAPGGDHVEVRERERGGPRQGPRFQGFDVEPEHGHQRKDGHPFIVKGAGDRPGHVRRHDRHERGRDEARAAALDLAHERKRRERGERGEEGRGEHAHLLHSDGEVKGVQGAVHEAGGPDEALRRGGTGRGCWRRRLLPPTTHPPMRARVWGRRPSFQPSRGADRGPAAAARGTHSLPPLPLAPGRTCRPPHAPAGTTSCRQTSPTGGRRRCRRRTW